MVKVAPISFTIEMQNEPNEDTTSNTDKPESGFKFFKVPSTDHVSLASRKILKAKRRGKEFPSTSRNFSDYCGTKPNSLKGRVDPKGYLKRFCERMWHVYDLSTRAYIEERGQEKTFVCMGNDIAFYESLGTRESKEQLERYLRAYSKYFKKTGAMLKTVPEEMWTKILEKLNIDDLKSFRLVSRGANSLVEKMPQWANDVCFVYDEKKKFHKECPPEQMCDDKTVGWPAVRLRNCARFTLGFWKDISVIKSLTILDLHDCNLSGSTLVTLLANACKLEEFNFTLSHDRLDHLKVQKKLEEFYETRRTLKKNSLRDEKSEFARTIKKRHSRYDKTVAAETLKFADILPKIKRITLDAASLAIINIILDILEELVVSSLEELRIHCRMEMCFLPYSREEVILDKKKPNKCNRVSKAKSNKAAVKRLQIRAKKLIENNQRTLKCLELSLNADEVNEEFEEFEDLEGRPTLVMIAHLFNVSYYPKLSLKELILDFPNLLPGINHHNSENMNDGCAYCGFRQLIEFCESQRELENLQLKRIHTSASTRPLLKCLKKMTKHAKVALWGTIYPGHLEVERDDIGSMLSVLDMQLGGNDSIKVYSDFYSKDKKSMEKLKRFEIRSESKWLTDFKVPLILQKFPNLTRLVVADIRMRSEGLESAPKINDEDFQAIIKCLPTLVELVIRTNMADVTDFGFTGLQYSGQDLTNIKSKIEELKKYCSKDSHAEELSKTGASINGLNRLELLELHGLGSEVTDFTAYFVAWNLHDNLRELYLFTPEFGTKAVKSIKAAFVLRKGFTLQVAGVNSDSDKK